MKVNFNNALVISLVITVLLSSASFALAHDPSTTNYPQLSHIHVKGKITALDGSVIRLPEGAMVKAMSSEAFRFIPSECHANQSPVTSPINPNTGEYELIFYFKADSEKCRDEFQRRPLDTSKIQIINAPGYEFKRKTN